MISRGDRRGLDVVLSLSQWVCRKTFLHPYNRNRSAEMGRLFLRKQILRMAGEYRWLRKLEREAAEHINRISTRAESL